MSFTRVHLALTSLVILTRPLLCSLQNDNILTLLKSKCPLDPDLNSPTEITGQQIEADLLLDFVKFIQINDVKKTFTVLVNMLIIWPAGDCVKSTLENSQFRGIVKNASSLYYDRGKLWAPKISHVNSETGHSLNSGDFKDGIRYLPSNNTFATVLYSPPESTCNLDLWLFPFDTYVFFYF